jgi:hypothetical protein
VNAKKVKNKEKAIRRNEAAPQRSENKKRKRPTMNTQETHTKVARAAAAVKAREGAKERGLHRHRTRT